MSWKVFKWNCDRLNVFMLLNLSHSISGRRPFHCVGFFLLVQADNSTDSKHIFIFVINNTKFEQFFLLFKIEISLFLKFQNILFSSNLFYICWIFFPTILIETNYFFLLKWKLFSFWFLHFICSTIFEFW